MSKVSSNEASVSTKQQPPLYTKFYAVRSCSVLQRPAIFYHEEDKDLVIARDAGDIIAKSFDNINEAHNWIMTTKVPTTKSCRKHKASSLIIINPIVTQRQEQSNQKWEEKFAELVQFTDTIGDGDPNLALIKEYHRPDLSTFLNHQRQDYQEYLAGRIPATSHIDRKTRYLRLFEIGVRLKQNKEYSWPTQAQKWKEFVSSNPAISLTGDNNPTLDPRVPELVQWQNKQIQEYIKMMRKERQHEMPPHRYQMLRQWNFPFPKNVNIPKKVILTFDERLQQFIEWKHRTGSALVPQSTKGLGEWVKEQRKEYRKYVKGQKAYINEERIRKLQEAGFIFEVRRRQSSINNGSDGKVAIIVNDVEGSGSRSGSRSGDGDGYGVKSSTMNGACDTMELTPSD